MPISYNSQPLIPAPFVNISKEYIKTGDGKKVGATYTISIEGTLIPEKGSPNSTGAFSAKPSDENITSPYKLPIFCNRITALAIIDLQRPCCV